jgi:hypothetical protein
MEVSMVGVSRWLWWFGAKITGPSGRPASRSIPARSGAPSAATTGRITASSNTTLAIRAGNRRAQSVS